MFAPFGSYLLDPQPRHVVLDVTSAALRESGPQHDRAGGEGSPGPCCELNCVLQKNSRVEVLIPRSSECDLIGKQSRNELR